MLTDLRGNGRLGRIYEYGVDQETKFRKIEFSPQPEKNKDLGSPRKSSAKQNTNY
jgi:hypothetical protein